MATQVRKLNLTIIDDDPQMVRFLETVIRRELDPILNIQVYTDPLLGRAALDQCCCDVLLTDLQMPDINGLDLLRFTKRRNSWTQVLFMTAHSSWDAIAEAIDHGASDYLLKPVNQVELIELLSQAHGRFTRWQTAARLTQTRWSEVIA